MIFEHLLFSQFFNALALGGALAQWLIFCWLAAPLGFAAPAWLHVLAPATLAVANYRAGRALDDERPGSASSRGGRLLLASAFAALAGAGTLVVCTAAWTALASMGVLPGEAGATAAGFATPAFDPGFRIVATCAVLLAGGAVAHGYVWGQRALGVTHLTVPFVGLPPALVGLRVVHLSDLHLGPLADRGALRDALARVVALDADLVLVTGDLVDNRAADLASWMPELACVTARHGVFAILGNHDRHANPTRIAAALAQHTHWRLLRDEVATITIDGARLHLLGLEDRRRSEAADGLPALLAQVPPGEPAILLAHRPTVFPSAAAAGVPLTLSGHTHGGQVAVPGLPHLNPARLLMTAYDVGTFRRDGTVLHVSRGLGTSGQPVRVAVPREITVVTLVAA
jgi:predicted MPP superfamily phosphohydrolase